MSTGATNMRRLVVLVIALVGLAACNDASRNASTATSDASPSCQTSALHARSERGGAATGHWIEIWALSNSSRRTCTLFGFPTVRLLDSNGGLIDVHVRHEGFVISANPPTTVRLAPGVSGYFGVETYKCDESRGPGVVAARIEAVPPGEKDSVIIPGTAGVCSDRVLIVSAIRATADQVSRGG